MESKARRRLPAREGDGGNGDNDGGDDGDDVVLLNRPFLSRGVGLLEMTANSLCHRLDKKFHHRRRRRRLVRNRRKEFCEEAFDRGKAS